MTKKYLQFRNRIETCVARHGMEFTAMGAEAPLIVSAEKRVGMDFPNELHEFLTVFNGGPIGDGFFLIGTDADDDRPNGIVESLLGIDPCPSVTALLPKGTVVDHHWKIPDTIPLASSSLVGEFGIHRQYRHKNNHVVLGMYLFGPVLLREEKVRRDPYGIVFVAASSLDCFLEHVIHHVESNATSRPFWDKEQTLAIDPELETIRDWPMPWDFRTKDIRPTYTMK